VGSRAALQAGIEYAPARVLAPGSGRLPAGFDLPRKFRVSFIACNPLPVANAPPVTVFFVTATATRGQYGSPEFWFPAAHRAHPVAQLPR